MRPSIFILSQVLIFLMTHAGAMAVNAPSAGGANPAGPATIALNWVDNSSDETGFEIERLIGSSWKLIATTPPNRTYYYDRGLNSETSYNYRIRSVNTSSSSTTISLGSAATTKQMNIIFFLADDMGYKDIVAFRNPAVDGPTIHETPALDALASEALLAENAYCSGPRCVVARRTIQTGKYDWRPEVVPNNDYYVDKNGSPIGGGLWAGGVSVAGAEVGSGVTIPFDNVTYGEALKAAGYRTCFIGKYHLGESPSDTPVTGYSFGDQPARGPDMQGYDVSIGAGHAGAPPASYYAVENMHAKGTYTFELPNLDDANYGTNAPFEGEYLTDRLTDKAIGFMEDVVTHHSDEPFCLTLAHYAVHTPMEAKASDITYFQNKKASMAADFAAHPAGSSGLITDYSVRARVWQDNAVYAAMMRSYDDSLAELRTYLAATDDPRNPGMKLSETTILIVSSDHGGKSTTPIADNKFLEDDRTDATNSSATYNATDGAYRAGSPNTFNSYPTSNYPYRQGKTWVYEGGLKVPLLIYYPSLTIGGERTEALIHHADFFATFVDMAGGVQSTNSTDSKSFMLSLSEPMLSARDEQFHFFTNANRGTGNPAIGAYRKGDYKLLYFMVQRRVELYNLAADPYEQNDLAASRADLAKEMLEALYQEVLSHGTKMPKPGSNTWTTEQNEILVRNGLVASLPLVPDAKPTWNGIGANQISDRTIELNWNVNASNATHSVIYRSSVSDGEVAYREHAYLPAGVTTFRDTNLSSGGIYKYRIESENLGGWATGNTGNKTVTLVSSDTALAAVAVDDTVTTVPDEIRRFNPLLNDEGEGALAILSITQPTKGSASIEGSSILYAAPQDFAGAVTMTYTIQDEAAQSDTASVTFNLPVSSTSEVIQEGWDFEGETSNDGLMDLVNTGGLNSQWNLNTSAKNDIADGSGNLVLSGDSGSYTRKLPGAGKRNAASDSDFYVSPVSTGKHRLEVNFAAWSTSSASNGDSWILRINNTSGARIASINWRVTATNVEIQFGSYHGNYRVKSFSFNQSDSVTTAVEFDFDENTIDYIQDGTVTDSFSFDGDNIGQIIFNKIGTWGTAATTIAIESIKLIEIVQGGNLYDAYATAYHWDGVLAKDASEDPDADGIKNLMEFAFGTSPTTANPMNAVTIGSNGSSPVIEFTPLRDTSMLTYKVQHSYDLSDWSTLDGQVVTTPAGLPIQEPIPGSSSGFSRLIVEIP